MTGWEEELGAIRAVPTRGNRYEAPCSALTALPRALPPRPAPAPGPRLAGQAPVAAVAKPNTDIFESLNEDKEQEDAVSSDDDMFRWQRPRGPLRPNGVVDKGGSQPALRLQTLAAQATPRSQALPFDLICWRSLPQETMCNNMRGLLTVCTRPAARSDESWDKKQKKERLKREKEQKAAEEAAKAAEAEAKIIKFCSAGNLNPADLQKEMNVHRQKRTVYRHDDSEYRVSAEEKQLLEAQLLEERKKEVLSRVERLECQAGHGIQGKYAQEKVEAERKKDGVEEGAEAGGGGTWAELSDSDEEDDRQLAEAKEGAEGEEDGLQHTGTVGGGEGVGEGEQGRHGAALEEEDEGLDSFLYKERTCECDFF